MTEPLDSKELAARFNALCDKYAGQYETNGTARAMREIDALVSAMNTAGIDISVDFSAAVSNEIFAMKGGTEAAVEGRLRLGRSLYLLAIFIRDDNGACLKVALSQRDVSRGPSASLPSSLHNFNTDAGQAGFRDKLLIYAADQTAVDRVTGRDEDKLNLRKDIPVFELKVKK